MKKKKVLFVCYGLGIGGIEKCFINLLNVMDKENYDIDVLLMTSENDLKGMLKNKQLHFLDSFQYIMSIEDTPDAIKERGGWYRHIGKTIGYMVFRLRIKLKDKAWRGFRKLPDRYDIAVAYSQNDYSPYYVIDKVRAGRKVLWYHNGAYERSEKKYIRDKYYYNQFDYIVAVSTDCAQMLRSKFEFAEGKLVVLKNIPDAETVKSKAIEFVPDSFQNKAFHIVTVGRMTSEKGADIALETCRKLVGDGRNVCWHWVGGGNQETNLSTQIEQLGLQRHFIMEGNKSNPYPYIKNAEIYVQPSYYEAYSTTVTEAKILAKPIISTDVGGMRDQLQDRKNGRIVPIDSDAIVVAIRELMDDKALRESFSKALIKESFEPERIFMEYEDTVFA